MSESLYGQKPEKYFGKVIANASFSEEAIILTFEDGSKIQVADEGHSCCEHRYMHTDDNVESLIGQTLTRIDVKEVDVPENENDDYEGDVHEICFLEIGTDKGSISVSTHNEHNGYYGGFYLVVKEVNEETTN